MLATYGGNPQDLQAWLHTPLVTILRLMGCQAQRDGKAAPGPTGPGPEDLALIERLEAMRQKREGKKGPDA